MKLFNFQIHILSLRSLCWPIIGFIFFVIAFFPGFMSFDSLEQYKQAHTLRFADGNPPVMAWLWSKLNLIWNGPQSLLFLQLGVLWIGLHVWHKNAGTKRFAIWFILLGFFPWVANFEGVLWKDVGMAFSLLLALGILSSENLTRLKKFGVVLLLLYAFMVRSNAPAALVPIVWYMLLRFYPSISHRIRIAFTTLTLLLMFVFSNFFNYQLLEAEKNNLVSYMMVDDLVHLSIMADKNLLPGPDFDTVKECSQEIIGETKLVGRLFCLITKPGYKNIAPIPYENLKASWISAVKGNPLEYAKFRLNAYFYLLRKPSEKPYIYSYSGISPNEFGLTQQDNVATIALKKYVLTMAHIIPFAFKPYWWLIVALLFLCATSRMEGDKDSATLIRVLLISALLYMMSYVPVTPMADFRYVYWSTLAISLATLKFATSSLSFKLTSSDKDS